MPLNYGVEVSYVPTPNLDWMLILISSDDTREIGVLFGVLGLNKII